MRFACVCFPAGVSALLTVALDGAREPSQLQMVEFGRGFGYKLPLSVGMPSLGGNILKQIVRVKSFWQWFRSQQDKKSQFLGSGFGLRDLEFEEFQLHVPGAGTVVFFCC